MAEGLRNEAPNSSLISSDAPLASWLLNLFICSCVARSVEKFEF